MEFILRTEINANNPPLHTKFRLILDQCISDIVKRCSKTDIDVCVEDCMKNCTLAYTRYEASRKEFLSNLSTDFVQVCVSVPESELESCKDEVRSKYMSRLERLYSSLE
jgi:hypothetical protein